VGVDGDELDPFQPGVDHPVDGVDAAAADADDLDHGEVVLWRAGHQRDLHRGWRSGSGERCIGVVLVIVDSSCARHPDTHRARRGVMLARLTPSPWETTCSGAAPTTSAAAVRPVERWVAGSVAHSVTSSVETSIGPGSRSGLAASTAS